MAQKLFAASIKEKIPAHPAVGKPHFSEKHGFDSESRSRHQNNQLDGKQYNFNVRLRRPEKVPTAEFTAGTFFTLISQKNNLTEIISK